MSDKTWSENTTSDEEADEELNDVSPGALPWEPEAPWDDDDAEQVPLVEPSVRAPAVRASAPDRPPRGSSRMPNSEPGLEHEQILSITVTPATMRYNVPLTLVVQLQNAQALLRATGDALDNAMIHGMRLLQGVIARHLVAIEAGKRRGKYHLQGMCVVRTTERNPEMVVYAVTQLMHATVASVGLTVRITKTIKPAVFADELYLGGYMQKDEGLNHHSRRSAGYDAAWLARATRVYRSKAGSNTYSSDKVNNNPEKDRRTVPLNTVNLLQFSRWFVLKEGMRALLPVASVAVRTAWMLQTDNYYLETKVINGNAGAPLDEARMEALNCLLDDPRARENVAIVRCVLYGAPTVTRAARDVHQMLPSVLGLPTREQVDHMTLHEAKAFACKFNSAAAERGPAPMAAGGAARPPAATRIGVAVIVDLAGSAASARAAAMLHAHGFQVHSLVANDQFVNACGHIAEMAAVILRATGNRFDELPLEQIQAVNRFDCIRVQEAKLGRALQEQAAPNMLTDDEIIQLASLDNPDARGTPPTWMPGPGPFNAFADALRESTEPRAESGSSNPVQIMIVNSVEARTLADSFVGNHWLTIAWQLRPATA